MHGVWHTHGNNTLQKTTFLIRRRFKTWNTYSRGPTRSSGLFNLLVDVIQWRLSLSKTLLCRNHGGLRRMDISNYCFIMSHLGVISCDRPSLARSREIDE
ncbi:hypothetical protein CDAR_501711 [Caerostris darwini]|uniref:Uncharacterized protein n=1 Tax=Caerostris darwini TaxID=1538125 RepID=A0AAV4TPU6_9ARAC|nr:hypothetical protein CDAR_501711 [Caerostris darwini]